MEETPQRTPNHLKRSVRFSEPLSSRQTRASHAIEEEEFEEAENDIADEFASPSAVTPIPSNNVSSRPILSNSKSAKSLAISFTNSSQKSHKSVNEVLNKNIVAIADMVAVKKDLLTHIKRKKEEIHKMDLDVQ